MHMFEFALAVAVWVVNTVIDNPELLRVRIDVDTGHDADTFDDVVCIATPLTPHDAHLAGVVFVGHRIVKDEIAVRRLHHLCAHVFPDQMGRNTFARQITIDLIVAELLRMLGKVRQRVVDLTA